MRISIIAYLLQHGRDFRSAGVSVYADQLLRALPTACPNLEITAHTGPRAPSIPGVRTVRSPIDTRRAAPRILWEQVSGRLLSARQDILHGTVNTIPLAAPIPTVVTIHDLSFLRFPDRLPRARRAFLSAAVPASARRATRVIAISESTKRDIVELIGIPEGRISVVYQGVDAAFRPGPSDISAAHFAGRPYILHVGTVEPRKNLDILVRAYAALRRDGIPHALALVGPRGWMDDPVFAVIRELGLQDDVRLAGYVPPADLPRWYNGADLFAFPSAYEGFGLPILEAMACGVPTVTSNGSSLGEVAGTAALTVDAGSVEDLHDAMGRILSDQNLAARLRDLGRARAAKFTWESTARGTAAVYEDASR